MTSKLINVVEMLTFTVSCMEVGIACSTGINNFLKSDTKKCEIALSAVTAEYTDCISAEGEDSSPNECPRYDTKQSDGKVPVMLWEMWSSPSLLSLQGPLWP